MQHTINNLQLTNKRRGYIALTTVLIIGAFAVVVSTSMLLISTTYTKTAIVGQEGLRAKSYAEACTEYSLNLLRQNKNYEGTENLNFTNGTCTVVTTRLGGQNNTDINATGVSGSSTRLVKVHIDNFNSQINTSIWKEVINF